MFSEHLARCPVAEAASWYVVEAFGQGAQCLVGPGIRRRFAWQKPPNAAIGILNSTFLPWTVRITEVAGDRKVPCKYWVVHELSATVEGNTSPCRRWQVR